MKKHFFYILLAALFSFVSCSEDPVDDVPDWATVGVFEDYFLKKYESPMLTRTLTVDINEDAKHKIHAPIALALVDSEGISVAEDKAQLYQDGQIAEDNVIMISPSDTEIEIGLKLNKAYAQANEGVYYWGFEVLDNPGYEMLCGYTSEELAELGNLLDSPQQTIKITVNHVANKVKVWTNTIVLVVLSVIVAWILLLQINVPRFNQKHIRSIFIITNGARRCITNCTSDADRSVEIVISSQELKQSFISKLFMGRKCFVKLENFPAELHMTPKKGGKVNYKSEPRTAFKMTRNGQVHQLTSTTESNTTYQVEFR